MRVLFVSLFIVIVDQVSKVLVKGFQIPFLNFKYSGMFRGQHITLIDKVLYLSYVENPGIAFGIDFGASFKLMISIFTILASIGLFAYLYSVKEKNFSLRLSLALILGGAVGNLIDRVFYGVLYWYGPLFYGKVVDFIDLRILNFYIFNRTFGNYIFNFADVAVTAGVILLLFAYNKQKQEKNEIKAMPDYLVENKE